MNAITTNVRAVRPVADTEDKWIIATGRMASSVSWAIAALEHGDPEHALQFLAQAQLAAQDAYPEAPSGATRFYTPRSEALRNVG